MNTATLVALKKTVDLAKVGIEYIEHDQRVSLGMLKPQWIEFEGKGIGEGAFDNGVLKITSHKGSNTVRLDSSAFRAVMRYWNGPDLVNNKIKDGRLESSLWHDLIWVFAKDIAKEWGCRVVDVMCWANGLFHAAWKDYGNHYPSARFVKQKARIAYGVVSFATPWYHRAKKILGLSVVVLCLSGCSGCSLIEPPPDIRVAGSSGIFCDDDVESIEPWVSTNVISGVK